MAHANQRLRAHPWTLCHHDCSLVNEPGELKSANRHCRALLAHLKAAQYLLATTNLWGPPSCRLRARDVLQGLEFEASAMSAAA